MLIIPAIDLLDGKVVRLVQGDYEKVKIYSDDPAAIAVRWEDAGAKLIHVVDLDGAKTGRSQNLKAVEKILAATDADIELGGGIRDMEGIYRALDIGVSYVVLGSAAFKDKKFAEESALKYGDKIIVGIDVRSGEIALEGWTEGISAPIENHLRQFEQNGIKRIIFTDIHKDGMLEGPNIEALTDVLEKTSMEVIASGGVTRLDDLKALKELEDLGLKGVIIGKALYEGKINLAEAVNAG